MAKRIVQLINHNGIAVYVDFDRIEMVVNDGENGGTILLESGNHLFLDAKSTEKAVVMFLRQDE